MTPGNLDMERFFNIRRDWLIYICLILATLAVYWQVGAHEFVYYDDDIYVSQNRHIQSGLTSQSIAWAFTATHASNWHPLTWLSHMLDYELFGLDSGRHHLTNVFFHIANTLLLFIVLRGMTGESRRSGFVAALFALHPLHVESVAWLSERKDVLSTFFWMLTMWSYAKYAERPSAGRYAPIVAFFILGILSKPMIVTLPFVLVLLDYWPLRRIQLDDAGGSWRSLVDFRLILEKTPLFALAAASSIVTFIAQRAGGSVKSLVHFPLDVRVANALVSYFAYIGKMFYPFHLAVLYPHPGRPPLWQIAGAGALFISISALAVRGFRRHTNVSVGWFWYVGTLVPVIGFVQVGNQAMADRYTYIPFIGIFVIIAWGVPELAKRWPRLKVGTVPAAAMVLAVLFVTTFFQVRN